MVTGLAVAVVPTVSIGTAAAPASDAPGIWEHIPVLVQAGAIGFAMLGIILSFWLLMHRRVKPGMAFLGAVLFASFVFLWAERASVNIVRFPNQIASDIPIIIKHNNELIGFDSGIVRLECTRPIDLSINVEGMVQQLMDLRGKLLLATSVTTTPAEAGAVGIDADAGAAL